LFGNTTMCVVAVNGISWNFFISWSFALYFNFRVTYEQRPSYCVSFCSYLNIFVILQMEYLFMNLINFSNVLFYICFSEKTTHFQAHFDVWTMSI
jgi:hypothetical protein